MSCTDVAILPASSLSDNKSDTDSATESPGEDTDSTTESSGNDTHSATESHEEDTDSATESTEEDTDSATESHEEDTNSATESTEEDIDTEYHFFTGNIETCSQLLTFVQDCMPEIENYVSESCRPTSVTDKLMVIADCANDAGCNGMTGCILNNY